MKKVLKGMLVGTTALAALPLSVSLASATTSATPLHEPMKISTIIASPQAHTNVKIKNNATSTYQSGMTPAQMKKAYGINLLSQTGAGQTIAIVDAYGSPTIQNDLNVFSSQFGLPTTTITIAQPGGAPATDGGWALETALDVEWVHALAPQANIMLVEAKTASIADLVTAIDYATGHGAVVVSNSWGGGEWSGELSYDTHFNHTGVTYVASSGDSGAGVEWPAASPYVLGVGGTTLSYDSTGTWLGETAWSGSGGATSVYEARPSYQNSVSTIVGSHRGVPDVGMDADPNSGAAVYDSTPDSGQSGWFQVGGTSLAAPMWASLVGLTDQSRSSKLTSFTAISDLYSLAGSNYSNYFHDITSGSNGNPAQVGYDLVTGWGSPKANTLVPAWVTQP